MLFFFATRGANEHQHAELMLWPPDSASIAAKTDPKNLTPEQLDKIADRLDKNVPGWVDEAAEDMPEASEKIEITREQLLSIVDEALKVRGVF